MNLAETNSEAPGSGDNGKNAMKRSCNAVLGHLQRVRATTRVAIAHDHELGSEQVVVIFGTVSGSGTELASKPLKPGHAELVWLVVIAGRRPFVFGLVACITGACDRTPSKAMSEPEPEPESEPATPTKGQAIHDRVAQLEAEFADRGWVVLAEPPFVVVGDGARERVEAHARTTVRWAVEKLEAAYFERPPSELITIWLFETSESYETHARELFGDPPDTPYGYYSGEQRALVMNIGTGGGTLVHEIVHPYMAANFPACPTWFNEGLASLYEQSAERGGEIVGLTNWRLAGLQDALAAKTLPSFLELCESGEGFYTADPGSNYGQARYLCYWLQEQGLLRRFYQQFRAHAAEDPSGYATLSALVGPDMDDFRTRWETFVLGLRFG